MMRALSGAARIVLALVVLSGPAAGQQRQNAPPPPKEEPRPEPPPASYEPELLRLAEVLGTLSYLSTLCAEPSSGTWAGSMMQLIDAEGTTAQRRERLIAAYNRGYIGHQPAHRACTDGAREQIRRLVEQGQRLSREIATRYSG